MAQMNVFVEFVKENFKTSHPLPMEIASLDVVLKLVQDFLATENNDNEPGEYEAHNQFWLKEHTLSWKIMLLDSFWNFLDESLLNSKTDVDSLMIFLMDQVQDSEQDVSEINDALSVTNLRGRTPTTNVSFDRLLNAAKNGSFVGFIENWRASGQNFSENEILKILHVTMQNSAKCLATEVQDRIKILEVIQSEHSKLFRIKSANLLHLTNIHIDILLHLINQDANLFAQNAEGQTLLHLCPRYLSSVEYSQLVSVICKRNQDFAFRILCSSGIDPLHAAVKMFELTDETVHLLHSRQHLGPNCIDNDGKNIYDIAQCSQRSEEFLKLLQKYNILPSTRATQQQKEENLNPETNSTEKTHRDSAGYSGCTILPSIPLQKTKTRTPLLVGDPGCSFQEIVQIFDETSVSELLLTSWKSLSMHLGIPLDSVKKWQQDLLLDKRKHIVVILEILTRWRMIKGDDATLGALYEAIPNDMKEIKDLLQNKIRKKANGWNDLDEDSQKVVLQTNVKFLGRCYSLSSLCDMMSGKAFEEMLNNREMKELFDNSFKNETWDLGPFQIPQPLAYYINRKLVFKRRLNPAIFKHNCSDIFLIEGIQHHHLSFLARPELMEVSSEQLRKVTRRFILLEHPDDHDEITKLASYPVHRIKHEDNQFYWMSTAGSCQIIRIFLTNDVEEIEETTLVNDHLSTFNNRPIAISSNAAMGKSQLLANLARQMIKCYPKRIVIYLELRSLIAKLSLFGPEIDAKNIKLILVSSLSISSIGQKILLAILHNEQMIFEIFLDGFDEISLDFIQSAKHFFKCLLQFPNLRVYITSRPHMQNEIENTLEVISLDIAPFNQENQVKFLCDSWILRQNLTNREKLSQFALMVLESLESMTRTTNSQIEFAGNPLHCYMLAQLYEFEAKRFCNRDLFNFEPEKSFYDLYSTFMTLKFKNIEDSDRQLIKMCHWKEALMLLFPENQEASNLVKELTKMTGNERVPWDKVFRVGILELISDKAIFVHRTFAEYLVAEFVVEELLINELVDPNISVKFIIDCVLFVYETTKKHKLSESYVKRIKDVVESSKTGLAGSSNLKKLQADLLSQCNEPIEEVGNNVYTILFNALAQYTAKPSTDILDSTLEFLECSQLVDDIYINVLQGNRALQHEMVCTFVETALERHDAVSTVKKLKCDNVCLTRDWNQLKWKLLLCTEKGYQALTPTLIEFYCNVSIFNNVLNMDHKMSEELIIRASYKDNVPFFQYICDTVKPFLEFNLNDFFKLFTLKDKIFSRTPLFKSISKGNYKLVEYLIGLIGSDVRKIKDLWLACFFESWKDSENVIRNKLTILRLLKSFDQDFKIDTLEMTFPRGVNVELLTTVYTICDYVPTENNVDYMASSINYCSNSDNEMNNLVNWLLSKNTTHLLIHKDRFDNCLLHHALLRNVLNPDTLSMVYSKFHFDLGIILKSAVSCKRSEAIVKTIVELSGDVNVVDDNKSTLMHWAAGYRKLDVIKYLLSVDANVNYKNAYGKTPLSLVFQDKDSTDNFYLIHDAVNLLVSYQADVSATNIAGLSPLDLAMAHQDEMSIEEKTLVLLRNSVPHNSAMWALSVKEFQNSTNSEACLQAFFCDCFFAWVWMIVQTSGKVDLSNPHNATLLHYAALFGELKATEYLLQNGADANLKDNDGDTPLHYVFDWDRRNRYKVFSKIDTNSQGIHRCVKLLLKYNADVSVKNKKGETALDWAQQQKYHLNKSFVVQGEV